MPTIVKIGNVAIRMFADDHAPPHFHVVSPAGEIVIGISDFSIIVGEIDRRSLDIALKWAVQNRDALDNEWTRLNQR